MEPFATIDDLNARRASDLTGRAASVAQAEPADASAKRASSSAASTAVQISSTFVPTIAPFSGFGHWEEGTRQER